MSRWMLNLLLVVLGLAALATQAKGQCSKFGHSCYGGHGKRNGDGFANVDYAVANQVAEKAQDDAISWDDSSVSNPEIVANVRNWLSVLGRRLRSRSSSQASAAGPFGYLQ